MTVTSGHFETVLVCDDDDDVRELLTRVLGLRAYSVLSARSAREALEIVRRQEGKVHLLVTDVAMPEMGGIELAAEVRKAHPSLAVLYISGYTENAALLSAPLGPNTYFLAKPFLPGDLTSLVSSILERPAQSHTVAETKGPPSATGPIHRVSKPAPS